MWCEDRGFACVWCVEWGVALRDLRAVALLCESCASCEMLSGGLQRGGCVEYIYVGCEGDAYRKSYSPNFILEDGIISCCRYIPLCCGLIEPRFAHMSW